MRTYAQQKAGLTRAVKKAKNLLADKAANERAAVRSDSLQFEAQAVVRRECERTVAEWESQEWASAHHVRQGAWPDDWARWQRALDDIYPWNAQTPRLEELA